MHKPFWALSIAIVLAMGLLAGGAPVAAQAPGVNLLTNGDFEYWDWTVGHWPQMWGIPEVQICPGWQAYWIQDAPEGVPMRENWRRPEFRDVKAIEADYRVRSGQMAQKYFSFGGQHIAGIYQQVEGITPGTTLRFEVYMQTWGCMAGDQGWNICPTGHLSNSPSPFNTRVGIDPTGGTSHGASTVVWGPVIEAYDAWTHFQVEAVAQSSTVTVFTYSHPDWRDNVFRMHNDVYIDDASLIALDVPPVAAPTEEPSVVEPAAPPEPAESEGPAAPEATPTPVVTPTPRPDGAMVHVVQSGDTLNAIALAYDVEPDAIRGLNALDDASWLSVGQELVISVDGAPITVEVQTMPEPTPVDAATPTVPATPAPQVVAGAAAQPVAMNLTLPTPTPHAGAAHPTSAQAAVSTGADAAAVGGSREGGAGVVGLVVPLALAIASGVGLGVVLNGRIKRG